MKKIEVIQFNFNNFFDNPIVKLCNENLKEQLKNFNCSFTVYTLNDLIPTIEGLKHSKFHLDKYNEGYNPESISYIGDQLRLYLALQTDNFLYVDGDAILINPEKILSNKNCCAGEELGINNGAFFYTDKNCEFNKYYYDLYQNDKVNKFDCNIRVFNDFPFKLSDGASGDMKIFNDCSHHYFMSGFREICRTFLKKGTTFYITKERKYLNNEKFDKPIIIFSDREGFVSNFKNAVIGLSKTIDIDKQIEVCKEQLEYMSGKNITFIPI